MPVIALPASAASATPVAVACAATIGLSTQPSTNMRQLITARYSATGTKKPTSAPTSTFSSPSFRRPSPTTTTDTTSTASAASAKPPTAACTDENTSAAPHTKAARSVV